MDGVERRATNTGHAPAGKSIKEVFDFMNSKKNSLFIATLPLMVLTLLSLVAAANPSPVSRLETLQSDQDGDKKDIRIDRRDIKKDKKDLAKDRRDVAKDRKDINQDRRDAARDRRDITEDKREIKQDKKENNLKELARDKRELAKDRKDLNNDRRGITK